MRLTLHHTKFLRICLYLVIITSVMSVSSTRTIPQRIVIIGGGIQGTCVAYYLRKHPSLPPSSSITILEAKSIASAASGKGGGFMARSWGDGGPTESLHHVGFDLYEEIVKEIECTSYRKIPVLSVQPGRYSNYIKKAKENKAFSSMIPNWLDGNTGAISSLGSGNDTAQVTPGDFVTKIVEYLEKKKGTQVILGACTGVASIIDTISGKRIVTGVQYQSQENQQESTVIPADVVVVCAGPWSCSAQDWFDDAIQIPMEGIKSTSIVWEKPKDQQGVDATALFCGEDDRFGTHCKYKRRLAFLRVLLIYTHFNSLVEVYPRPDDTVYICGIGGSDYVQAEDLRKGAFLYECNANDSRVEAASKAFKEMSVQYKRNGQLEKVQACMRPYPPDAMPYMGPIPRWDGAYINAGHNCWGIAWAPACGKAMSELILQGKSESVDLRPFAPDRFQRPPNRGDGGRKKMGESVGEQW